MVKWIKVKNNTRIDINKITIIEISDMRSEVKAFNLRPIGFFGKEWGFGCVRLFVILADDANADFAATNLNGAEANFSWVDNYLMVDFKSAVPEPASIAGIAGILALAFATYRRRK